MRLGNGNESDSSAPTIRLATLIRGARTAAGGERARILGVGASTAASTPGDVLGSAHMALMAALACIEPCTHAMPGEGLTPCP